VRFLYRDTANCGHAVEGRTLAFDPCSRRAKSGAPLNVSLGPKE
jgi:hypothetical protein